jgi:hypothetical protein
MYRVFKRNHLGVLFLAFILLFVFTDQGLADTLSVVESQVTSSSMYESVPKLGHDTFSDVVVFTSREDFLDRETSGTSTSASLDNQSVQLSR